MEKNVKNSEIINHWSFIGFCKAFGRPQRAKYRNNDTGDQFVKLLFTNKAGHQTEVFFAKTERGLSVADIVEQKDTLQVIQLPVSEEQAKKRAEKNYQPETYVLCKSGVELEDIDIEGVDFA